MNEIVKLIMCVHWKADQGYSRLHIAINKQMLIAYIRMANKIEAYSYNGAESGNKMWSVK